MWIVFVECVVLRIVCVNVYCTTATGCLPIFSYIYIYIYIYISYHIKSRRMRYAGRVKRMGDKRGAYRVLLGIPEEKRLPGRPRLTWEDNIKMDLLEVGLGCMDWLDVSQDRGRWWALVIAVINIRVTFSAGNFLTGWEPVNLSGMTVFCVVIYVFVYVFIYFFDDTVSVGVFLAFMTFRFDRCNCQFLTTHTAVFLSLHSVDWKITNEGVSFVLYAITCICPSA